MCKAACTLIGQECCSLDEAYFFSQGFRVHGDLLAASSADLAISRHSTFRCFATDYPTMNSHLLISSYLPAFSFSKSFAHHHSSYSILVGTWRTREQRKDPACHGRGNVHAEAKMEVERCGFERIQERRASLREALKDPERAEKMPSPRLRSANSQNSLSTALALGLRLLVAWRSTPRSHQGEIQASHVRHGFPKNRIVSCSIAAKRVLSASLLSMSSANITSLGVRMQTREPLHVEGWYSNKTIESSQHVKVCF